MGEITQILDAIGRGEAQAAEQLLPAVYDDLRRLAAKSLAQEAPGQSLQATALVLEPYVRLVDSDGAPIWNHPGHLFTTTAEAM